MRASRRQKAKGMFIKGMIIGIVVTTVLGCALTGAAARSLWQEIAGHAVRITVEIMPGDTAGHVNLSLSADEALALATLP
jgi:hypothetical protein